MIPVRCFSCGQVIGDLWAKYNQRVNVNGEDPAKVLEELNVKRYCCRRMLVSHVDLIKEIITYNKK